MGVDAQARIAAGTSKMKQPEPHRTIPDLDDGDRLTVTVGEERFVIPNGCSFTVGAVTVEGRVRPGETPSACYHRLVDAAQVLFEVEYETKLKSFVKKVQQVKELAR